MLGVALDVYHVWWDPKLESQIVRAGAKRLLAYHVCDWLVPTRDLLNDRGMMGDGIIELQKIRGWVEAAGYSGFAEVEIFSDRLWSSARGRSAGHLRRALSERCVGGVSGRRLAAQHRRLAASGGQRHALIQAYGYARRRCA